MSIDSPPLTAPSEPPNNLPLQLTSFIGREREIAEVTRLLTTTRLLTLTGAGGSGKTRLALQVAADAAGAYPDGVWLAELAALADPALVPQVVASAVGMRPAPVAAVPDGLVEYLRGRTLLLILDNCEHVVGAAAQLMDTLLRSCPGLRVLATSREALGSAGETVWHVPSLAVPPVEDTPAERLLGYEAVRLFMDRARATLPGFAVTDQNAPALAEICRRLDGIPLAIELAAARVRVFSVEQIAARLDNRFALLTAGQRTAMPRQQTLQATVDWSYNLLSEPERALLRRLSVFAGGWSFEAAEAVGAGDGIARHALLDLLAQLVDKSLVLAEEQRGAVRYRLLETIRQYAREKLQEAGEEARARDRHLAYFIALAEETEPKLRGAENLLAAAQLEEEHDNLRVALEWSLTRAGPAEAALRLSGALAWFWWLRSYHDEGLRWLTRALTATPDRTAARMKALHVAGWLAHHRRDSASAQELFGESLAIARELHDRWTEAWVLHGLGRIAYFDDDSAGARALGQESLAIAEAAGDEWLIAWALHLLGLAAYIANDFPTARRYYERGLAIRRALGYQEGIGILLFLLGVIDLREGDLASACAHIKEQVTITQAIHGPWGSAMCLAGMSYIAAAQGEMARAIRLGTVATTVVEVYHTPLIPMSETLLAEALAIARGSLSEAAYATAVQEGRTTSFEAAVADALAIDVVSAAAPATAAPGSAQDAPVDGLTAAERQVLRLLTTGRTTREIAAELVVAVSTVDRHLTHIYQKLGVRNRAEAVTTALQQRLV